MIGGYCASPACGQGVRVVAAADNARMPERLAKELSPSLRINRTRTSCSRFQHDDHDLSDIGIGRGHIEYVARRSS